MLHGIEACEDEPNAQPQKSERYKIITVSALSHATFTVDRSCMSYGLKRKVKPANYGFTYGSTQLRCTCSSVDRTIVKRNLYEL